MHAAGRVVVGYHSDDSPSEMFRVFVSPLSLSERVRGGGKAQLAGSVGVFFPATHRHGPFARCVDELREPIRHQPDALYVPFPTSAAVGPALAKVFGIEADRLIEELAVLVRVVVGCDDPPALSLAATA